MKWILIVVGGIVALVAMVALLGTLLPKGHVASRAAKFKNSPDEIWQTITDFPAAPEWRTDVRAMERLPDQNGHPVWKEQGQQGPITYEVTEFIPPQRLMLRIADDKLPFGGTWTYEITATESGSTLRITENGEVYNPIFRFMARFVFGHHATIEAYLKALGKKYGEEITFSGDHT